MPDEVLYVISIEGAVAVVHGDMPHSLRQELSSVCSYQVQGAYYIKKLKGWDGVRKLFNENSLTFSVGLIDRVKAVIASHHKARGETAVVYVADTRPEPEVMPATEIPDFSEASLVVSPHRPYQVWACDKAIADGSGLVQLPTGSGKTRVIAMLISRLKHRAVVYVHTRDLLYQMKEDLATYLPGIVVGQIGDGVCDPQTVTVCMVQTVAFVTESVKHPKDFDMSTVLDEEDLEDKLRDYDRGDAERERFFMERFGSIMDCIQGAGVLIFDESHHVPARTHVRVALLSRNARYRFGFSATQYRNDGAELDIQGCLGPAICTMDASDLTPQYLVPAHIRFVDVPARKFAKTDKYQTIYSEYVINNQDRNDIILSHTLALVGQGRKVIILVNRIAHGENILKLVRAEGLAVEFIKGELESEERHAIISAMRAGSLDVMIGTTLADEGLNIPVADALIVAGAGRSRVKTLQRVGRVLRQSEGKSDAIVIDFWDRCNHLRNHAANRYALYQLERGWKVTFDDGAGPALSRAQKRGERRTNCDGK